MCQQVSEKNCTFISANPEKGIKKKKKWYDIPMKTSMQNIVEGSYLNVKDCLANLTTNIILNGKKTKPS